MEEDTTDAQIIHENIKKKLIAGPPKIMAWLNDLLEMQEAFAESNKIAINELKEKHEKEIREKWQEIFEVRQENLDLRKELRETKELSVQVSNAFLSEVNCQSGAERKKKKRRKKTMDKNKFQENSASEEMSRAQPEKNASINVLSLLRRLYFRAYYLCVSISIDQELVKFSSPCINIYLSFLYGPCHATRLGKLY